MKKITYLLLLGVVGTIGKAQDIHFSQYGDAPLAINPALTAVAYDFRAILNYKSQWASVTSPYKTYAASIEYGIRNMKLKKAHMTTGVSFFRDKAGDSQLGTTHVNLNLGVAVKISKNDFFSGAIQGGVTSKSIDYTALQWDSQFDGFEYDAALPTGERNDAQNLTYADFAGGINFHHAESDLYISSNNGTRFDIGASVYHFNTPKQTWIADASQNQYMRYNAYANFVLCKKNSNMCFMPGVLYMMQGPSKEIMGTIMAKYIIHEQSIYTGKVKPMAISLGAQFRVKDAFIPTFLFEYDNYALGVSYDLNLSTLTTASKSKGGLEICLRYNWNPGYGKMLGGSWLRPTYK